MISKLTSIAKQLRINSTDAERKLWQVLRAKQLCGLKFRRQQIIGNYIVDFVCFDKKIIIELDGSQHGESEILLKDKIEIHGLKNKDSKFYVSGTTKFFKT